MTTCGYFFQLFLRLARLLVPILLAAFLAACAIAPEPLTNDELNLQAENDIDLIFTDAGPLPEVLTLPQAIARALKYNLDHRVKMMEEALALGQFELDKFDILPKLTANAGYHDRSEFYSSRNIDMVTGEQTDSNPTYSSEKERTTTDLTLSWNILDFGISYYTAKQSADRALIAGERRRKVVHNLIQEVFFAYWRVAAYQKLQGEIQETIQLAEKEFANAEMEIQERLTDPLQALRYQKMLMENIWKLETIEQEFSTARIELATLVSTEPGSYIRVAVPELGNLEIPGWDIPLDTMEELAFRNNPDIRERAYQSRIAIKETHKAILRTLPGITLSTADKYNSNELLVDKHWYEWSAQITWNVFNILSAPARIERAETGEKVAEMQRLALRMAVLAQVHVANRQFHETRKQYQNSDRFFQVTRQIADLVAVRRLDGGQSIRDSVYERTNEIIAELRRYQTYAKLQAAHRQLHATIGLDITPGSASSDDLQQVTAATEEALSAWESGALADQAMEDLHSSPDEDVEESLEDMDSELYESMANCAEGCTLSEEDYFMFSEKEEEATKTPSLKPAHQLDSTEKEPDHSKEEEKSDLARQDEKEMDTSDVASDMPSPTEKMPDHKNAKSDSDDASWWWWEDEKDEEIEESFDIASDMPPFTEEPPDNREKVEFNPDWKNGKDTESSDAASDMTRFCAFCNAANREPGTGNPYHHLRILFSILENERCRNRQCRNIK